MNINKTIVVVSTSIWHQASWTRKQRFASHLSRNGYRVLYVNPPVFYSNRASLFTDIRGEVPKQNLIPIDETLHVLASLIPVPSKVSKIPFFEQMRFTLHYGNIRKTIKQLGWEKVNVHWAYFPQSIDFKHNLEEDFYLFDWVDRYDAYPWSNKKYMNTMENKAIRESDIVLTTAKGLFQDAAEVNQNSYYISNGVDFELYQRTDRSEPYLLRYGILMENWKQTAAFVGAIFKWIDLDLLKFCAEQLPDTLFVLAGPIGEEVDQTSISLLKEKSNVKFIGTIPKEEVPILLSQVHVGINPFIVDRLSQYVNPLKVYEYLAAGLPVVSTHMPEIAGFGDEVILADNREIFAESIKLQAGRQDEELIKARKLAAKKFDWSVLTGEMTAIVNCLFSSKDEQ